MSLTPIVSLPNGYGRFSNVISSIQFERILSASGPFQGNLLRPSDRKGPKKVAWIQKLANEAKILDWPVQEVTADLSRALLFRIMGEGVKSRAIASDAAAHYVRESEAKPDVRAIGVSAAIALALAGEKARALREVGRVQDVMCPLDFFPRNYLEGRTATVHLILGEYDLAMRNLERTMSVPSEMTKARLRLDPLYDPLRANPRFQALLMRDERIPVE